jgi:hypothetical protein
MIYAEVKQDAIKSYLISFSGNVINDILSGFGVFRVGDKILVSETLNGLNDVQRNIIDLSDEFKKHYQL